MTPSHTLLLIDMGSIAWPLYATNRDTTDVDATSRAIVERVRRLAYDFPHAAVCCDSGRCFRHDLASDYKGQRAERDAILQHQILLAREALAAEGFPVWAAEGFEADDVIATAVARAGTPVLIVTADKDLMQLVSETVSVKSAITGAVLDPAGVSSKFNVQPSQIVDYLSLVGDSADNVKGAENIGPKKAAALLATYQTLDALYAEFEAVGGAAMGLPLSTIKALKDFAPRRTTVRALLQLRPTAPIPFEQIFQPRVPQDAPQETDMSYDDEVPPAAPADLAPHTPEAAPGAPAGTHEDGPSAPTPAAPPAAGQQMAVRDPNLLEAAEPSPAEYERQLDPRSPQQALRVAQFLFRSKLFEGYGTPEAVLSTIMMGRELGLPAMTSLRTIFPVKGRHALSAQLVVALVLKSGLAEFFELVELQNGVSATYETQRRGARNPVKLTHTIEMAKTAGLVKPDSNWQKIPDDMLVARCSVRLARIVYPDLVANVYTIDELQELKG